MSAGIDDDVIDAFCAVATHDRLPHAIAERFGGLRDQVEFNLTDATPDAASSLLDAVRRIPHRFSGRHADWP